MKVINQIMFISIFFISYIGYSQDYKVGDLVKFKASISIIENNITNTNKTIIDDVNNKLNRLHPNYVFRIEKIKDTIIEVMAISFAEKDFYGYEKKIIHKDKTIDTTIVKYFKEEKRIIDEGKQTVIVVKDKYGKIERVSDYEGEPLISKARADANEITFSKLYNDKTYLINKDDFVAAYEKVTPFARVTLGVLSLPVKFRLQKNASFETSFNIGATVGIRLNKSALKPYAIYGQFGFNLGSTELNSSNSSIGLVEGVSTAVDSEKAIKALTSSLVFGVMAQYKKVQFGAYFGFDYISNNKEYSWNHQGKPWFSLGIGVDVFQPKDVKVNGQ